MAVNRKTLLLLVFSLFPILFYLRLFNGFFQQDEWLGYSEYVLHHNLDARRLIGYFFTPSVGHYTPLTILVVHTLFALIGLNYQVLFSVSILLHLVTSLVFFYLAKIIFKNNYLACLATFLFGIMASHYQSTGWVIADISTHGSSIFGLLSIIFIFKLIETSNRRNLVLSLVFLVISLLFKEITIGLFLLLPIIIFLFRSKSSILTHRWVLAIIAIGSFYILVRIIMVFSPNQVKDTTVFATQTRSNFIYNFATVPFKAISQSIIPIEQLKTIAKWVTLPLSEKTTGQKGSPEYEIFIVKNSLEVISLLISSLILLVFLIVLFKNKNQYLIKAATLGIAWSIVNSMIFSFAPERAGIISTIDSRYLYFVSMGVSLFWVSIAAHFTRNRVGKSLAIISPLILINAVGLNSQLISYSQTGVIRSKILDKIKSQHTKLPPKTIFYTESDKSYYGLPDSDRILPFQSGFGQTLLAWYFTSEQFPSNFFANRFLWDTISQGYLESGNRGFGYFRDFSQLVDTVSKYQLPVDSVISYRYDSSQNLLDDMTDDVKGRLNGALSPKGLVSPSNYSITASHNSSDVYSMSDNNRLTKWDSKLAYVNPQYLQLNLLQGLKISEIDIDSFTNLDQDKVGYSVTMSSDGKSWQEVFRSKRLPPNEQGITKIYLNPITSKFIRINQIGDHHFASWAVHELKVYATKD